ncbi:MAG: hypothetical protein JW931_05105 [Methanomicrobiaceae archaeon]|nr:hypothetical protein [Methanomicrobiaceae archaeon]
MKTAVILLAATIIMIIFIVPASGISLEEIDTETLDIPEVEAMDFSKTPIGSLESLAAYAEHLIEAFEELLQFIESIFTMLGMESDSDVKRLMDILNKGKDLTNK